MKRLFVAIEIPPMVRAQFYGLEEELGVKNSRWVKEENWHVTVLFLGEVEEEKIYGISEGLMKAAGEMEPFKLILKEARIQPPGKEARMVWAVFEESKEFLELAERVKNKLKKILDVKDSFKDGKTPHITLARFDGFSGVKAERVKLNGGFEVREIILMESELLGGGSRYTEIGSFALKAENR